MPASGMKRQRSGKGNEPPKKKARTSAIKQKARPDTLPWESVSMPGKLDDYEGFFGLEEVSDVDVVKDEATGAISFMSSAPPRMEGSGEIEDPFPAYGEAGDEGEESEFSGFGDDEGVAKSEPADESTKANETGAKEKATKKEKKAKKQTESLDKTSQDAGVSAKPSSAEDGAKDGETAPKEKATKKEKKTKKQTTDSNENANGAFSGLADEEDNSTDMSAWRSLHLSPDTLAALSKLRFGKPTKIQRQAIPEILSGQDVIGKASTGSGKTLAYGIPILERFLELKATSKRPEAGEKVPIALILAPTRELAHQIEKHMNALVSTGAFESPSIATITGGLSVQKQQRQLKYADVIVGTPGRLWEVISSGADLMQALKQIHYLVVDEADRLLSQGNFKEVEEILNALDRKEIAEEKDEEVESNDGTEQVERQTLVFSATFDRGLQGKLAGKAKPNNNLMSAAESTAYLISKLNFRRGEKPKFIDVDSKKQLAQNLKEGLIECTGTEKDLYLYALLLFHPNTRTLIFTNSISAVRRITPLLQNLNQPALALHSGMAQKARLRTLERFSANTTSTLVSTDVAARGLDIANVQLVIHYHLPRAADTYVHRSGRTARAGASGSSILICAPEEVGGVRRLVAKVHAQSALDTASSKEAARQGYSIRTLDIDRKVVSRLRPRAQLAKKIADTALAKEKKSSTDSLFAQAAEDLGVEYDSEELDKEGSGKRGRGAGRKKKEREMREVTKAELGRMKGELKGLLAQRVNVGVSEKYLTAGGVDVEALLAERRGEGDKKGAFFGKVDGLGMD